MGNDSQPESNGLIFAYDLDGKGGGKLLNWSDIENAAIADRTRWIHLDFTDAHAHKWLRERSGINSTIVDALLDNDSRPRAIEHDDGLLTILRGVNMNPGADPEDMVSIRLWLEPGRIVSTRRRRLLSVQSIKEDLDKGSGPKSIGSFLVMLVERMGARIAPVIDDLDEAVEAAEQKFHADNLSNYRGEFSELRRAAMRIRRFLAPQREGLERMSRQTTPLLTDNEKFELREEADRETRNLEDLDLVREKAMVAQEELVSQLAQQQNSRMYVLSIVAAIFLPLSFITGLLGMNVAGLPGTENPAGFIISALLMVVAALLILLLFRFKRWL